MSVLRERRDAIEIVTLNRPEKRNAIDPATSTELSAIFDELENDDGVRVVVLAATGTHFCAGVDLKIHAVEGAATSLVPGKGFAGLTERYFPKPIICAVNGAALGGGFELVLASDLVVAARSATFRFPEASLGLLADGGGLIRLQNRIALASALEMYLTGDAMTAERAHQLGLVNRLVDELDQVVDAAIGLAERILRCSQPSILLSKKLAYRALSEHESVTWPINTTFVEAIEQSADYWEGPLAWVEKRAPQYWT